MNYERFGRLNSKKIEELKNDSKLDDLKLYAMGKFFPYLPTRKKDMDQRHTVSSFKNMIQKYRYCYSLRSNCVALIKKKGLLPEEEECIEIENKVYVFTNIPYGNFDEIDCELLFDKKMSIPIKDEDSVLGYEATSVLSDMKKRKLSSIQDKLLRKYLVWIHFVSLESKYISINKLDEVACDEDRDVDNSVFNEFVWRLALFGKGIYKEGETKESNIKGKRSRVQDAHSLFHEYDRYGSLNYIQSFDYIHSFVKKLDDVMQYNHIATANKFFYEFLEEHYNTYLLDEFTGDKLLADSLSIYEDKIAYLHRVKENFAFLKNPYSKEYRSFFGKRKKLYLNQLFKAQQIMRKLKSEYHSIDDMVNSLQEEYDKTVNSMNILPEVIKNYKEDLGDNQLPNQGYGYLGDGLHDDEDENSPVYQIRHERSWTIDEERLQREEIEYQREEDEEQLSREEAFEKEIQRFVKENKPMELFEFDEKAYFEHHESISIKEVLKIKQLDVIDDVSLEGKFFSLREMTDWLGKRLFHFSFVEFDK
ncbi:hypothetical protein ACLHDG_01840 [Sulfurovum sp. CS9]|uniref:hypothetical protein n=1 Tax=Sulfurovum sp. CS9 TaxID=3391146 RepID=UPI0039E9E3D0